MITFIAHKIQLLPAFFEYNIFVHKLNVCPLNNTLAHGQEMSFYKLINIYTTNNLLIFY